MTNGLSGPVHDDARQSSAGPCSVDYRVADRVAVITINCPSRANALSLSVRTGLFEAWRRFEADDSALAAILTGTGDRAFCAGADLNEMAQDGATEPPTDWAPVLGDNVLVTKPTIAAVNGVALGGGFLQVQMCDVAIAATTARFGITEARWGRGSPWALPLFSMIPTRMIMELLLTAEPIDAKRAAESGFVNRVVEPADLMPTAIRMARAMARNAPLSMAAAKEMARIARSTPDPELARAQTRQAYARVYQSNDAQIGPRAFKQRVPPVWTGS